MLRCAAHRALSPTSCNGVPWWGKAEEKRGEEKRGEEKQVVGHDADLALLQAIVQQLRSKTVIFPANFEDRLILIFLSSLDLELIKNSRSPNIWAP